MALAARMRRLEAAARKAVRPPGPAPPDEPQWLDIFRDWGRRGLFRHEPDFDAALSFLHDALVRARDQRDPPFEPPADFLPDEPPWRRRECWRHPGRFPDVVEGLEWLQEMRWRVVQNVPPVGEAEFGELAAWFRAREPQLRAREQASSGQLTLGDGTRTCCWHVRFGLKGGPRAEGSGRCAETIRRLKARYDVPGSRGWEAGGTR